MRRVGLCSNAQKSACQSSATLILWNEAVSHDITNQSRVLSPQQTSHVAAVGVLHRWRQRQVHLTLNNYHHLVHPRFSEAWSCIHNVKSRVIGDEYAATSNIWWIRCSLNISPSMKNVVCVNRLRRSLHAMACSRIIIGTNNYAASL